MASHPTLAAKWRGGTNSWFDPFNQHTTPVDIPYPTGGHGTAVTGIMVGGEHNGKAYGVAPDAQWIAAKIFNDSGSSSVTRIKTALQWILDPDGDPNTTDAPHVVNNSWVLGSAPSCDESLRTEVQNLRAAGILPIFSAGNISPPSSGGFSPANYAESFAVGAVNNADVIYNSSANGPSACDVPPTDYPEIVAPGVDIYTTDLGGLFLPYTGTSMAAPHVAGALALLLSASPQLTVDQQEAALINGAGQLGAPGPDNVYGNGRLDVLEALYSVGTVDLLVTQSVSSGAAIVDWPLQYTISVANGGIDEATESTLTHTHSTELALGPIVTSRGSCSATAGNDIVCDLGEIFPGDAVTVTIAMTPTTSGITLTNTTLVSATAESDFNVQNNSVTQQAPVLAEAPFKVFVPVIIK
jgi:subtilisin family serine protease